MGQDLDGEVAGDSFGETLALSADGLVVATGSWRHDGYRGSVRVHAWDGTAWQQRGADIDGEADNDHLVWTWL